MSHVYTAVIRIPASRGVTRDAKVERPAFDAKIEVTMDLGHIALLLGRKAAASKGKKSVAMHGAVKAKFLGVK